MLLPAALACAERVDVSRAAWELILRKRWDGRVLLVRPRPPGTLFASAPHGGHEVEHDPAYLAFYDASVAAAACAPLPTSKHTVKCGGRGLMVRAASWSRTRPTSRYMMPARLPLRAPPSREPQSWAQFFSGVRGQGSRSQIWC